MDDMLYIVATKSPAEREEEEAARLVRPEPKKKPPRRDKERGRTEVEDADTDKGDKDLSMNYKDIGGSIVAMAAAIAKVAVAQSEEEFLEGEVVNPATGNTVKLKSLKNKPKDTPEGKTYQREYEKWLKQKEGPEEEEPDKTETQDEKPTSKSPPLQQDPESELYPWDEDDEEWNNSSLDDLFDQAVSGEEKAQQVLEKKLKPVPEDFPEVGDFNGALGNEAKAELEKQVQGWDYHTYTQNLRSMMDNLLQAQLDQKESDRDYFKSIVDVYSSQEKNLQPEGLKTMDMKTLLENTSDTNLLRQKQKLFEQALFSSKNDVEEAIKGVDAFDGWDGWEHKEVLKKVLTGVKERKQLKDDVYSDQLLSNLRSMEIEPDDIDFTDPRQREDLLMQVRRLGDNELAELVSGNEYYEAVLGAEDSGENVSISSKDKEEFFNTLGQDLELKGRFEQLTFANETGEPLVSPSTLLRLEYSLRNSQDEDSRKHFSSFSDFLLDFLMEVSGELEDRVVSGRTKMADQDLARKVVAQYRGLPGPLEKGDPYRPLQPEWRLPKSTQDLGMDDYITILKAAKEWLRSSFLTHVSAEYDADMACQVAVDYAIYSADESKYNGSVGAPEYMRLVDVLKRAMAMGDNTESE